ncbi:MAG: outer membrane protein assembly factor BamA [Beijerinckiaceae bacterium]|nr:outer membrane protein assembly factor BamA [Beijerinckiaceae bacterium]
MKLIFAAGTSKRSSLGALSFLSGILLAIIVFASPAFAQSIVVRGNSRVDAEAIRSYFAPGPGEKLDSTKIDQGLKDLVATGQFRDARVTRSGNGIVVTVVEGSVINRVKFEGNKKVKTEQLSGEIQSRSRGPFSQAIVDSDVQRLQEVYRRAGRSEAQVSARVTDAPNGRSDVTFVIKEGDKTGVISIDFVGNKAFSSYKLRNAMTTTESNFLSFLKTSDVYDPDKIASDLELIRKLYLKNGYVDMRVVSSNAEYIAEKKGYIVTIVVDEGEQYRIADVDVQSRISDVDANTLRSTVRSKAGGVYNAEEVEKSIDNINGEVAKRGYAFAQVRPRADRDFNSKSVKLVYTVEEGPRVFVERINVHGNTRTRDYVIRREFDMGEGDAYNKQLVDRAERRLKALGFFKSVKISNEPGSTSDRVIINVDVEDQPTGAFGVSGGYSTSDGIIGEVSISESNFLGRGQYVKLSGSNGQYSKGVEFSFTEPFFLDRRLGAGFDLFYKEQDNTRYSRFVARNIGFNLRAGVPLTEEWTVGGRYSLFQQKITVPNTLANPYSNCYFPAGLPGDLQKFPADPNVAGCLADGEASLAVLESVGTRYTSLAGTSITYSTLDNVKNPTEGIFGQVNVDVAGLGGDSYYVRATGEARYYYPIFDDIIGSAKVQGGHIEGLGNDRLRVTDHFFKGPELVRGFQSSGIGPRDVGSDFSANAIGGTTYFGGSVEVQSPIFGLPKEIGLKLAIFADAGTLFDYQGARSYLVDQSINKVVPLKALNGAPVCAYNGTRQAQCQNTISVFEGNEIRSSVGVGLLWASPLGPIRFDYAYVISKGQLDKTQAFRFSGGSTF